MIGQECPLTRIAVHHRQKVLANGVNKRFLYIGPDIGVDRVHLQNTDLPLVEHLSQDIQGGDRVNVAAAQDQETRPS